MPELKTKYKFIEFKLDLEAAADQKRKTQIWKIQSLNGDHLGQIRWRNAWRRYCFFVEENYGFGERWFDAECLGHIIHFISQLMNERERKRG